MNWSRTRVPESLAGLALVMNAGDFTTTYLALKLYPAVVSEANPFLFHAMSSFGVPLSLLGFGALFSALILVIYFYPRFFELPWYLYYLRLGVLAFLAGFKVIAVANNLYVLMRV